jgi:rhamnosyl/mannosyltransferase
LEWKKQLCGNSFTVAFVGRHARYKGLEVLIDAMQKLPNVHAIIAGDGPYRAQLESASQVNGTANRVHFVGKVSHRDKVKILCSSNAFVFPSTEITEAFGISQLEAMAVGLPVIASDLPTGVTDVSIHEETALLVDPCDAFALAQAIERLIRQPDLSEYLVVNARKRLQARFTTEFMVERNLELVKAVARGHGSPCPT